MSMALFLKAMILVLLTGTPASSRRLKPEALSQAAIVQDSQPNKVAEVGCPEGGCPDAKPEGETKKKNIVGGILKAAKGVAKAAAVAGVIALVKHHHTNNEKKKMWPTPPAEKDEVQESPTSTQNQGTDPYDSADETTEPETPAAGEEPEQEPKAQPSSPTSSEEESEVPAALTPAEEATAKWAAASPAKEVAEEPAEESEESPVKEAAEQPAKDAKESFAHLSTAPLFTVFFVTAAALQIAGAK